MHQVNAHKTRRQPRWQNERTVAALLTSWQALDQQAAQVWQQLPKRLVAGLQQAEDQLTGQWGLGDAVQQLQALGKQRRLAQVQVRLLRYARGCRRHMLRRNISVPVRLLADSSTTTFVCEAAQICQQSHLLQTSGPMHRLA